MYLPSISKTILLSTSLLLLTACGGGGGSTLDVKEIAINNIEAYADNNSRTAPTLEDYSNAGVQGVTADNIDDINALVDGLTAEDVDSTEEIKALVASSGINLVPIANAQSITLNEDTSKALTLTASDADGDSLTYTVVANPTHGTLSGTAPNMTYTPTANYFGSDSFTFKVNDGTVDSETVTVGITVTDVAETAIQGIKKTGQTKSYNEAGDEVADGSIKDDGFYQKGVEPSYTRDDATEIVEDHLTGLMWQDDAEAKTIRKPWVTQESYDAGNYSDTIGDTATTYCSNLTLGNYTDWRLPTVVELQGIVVDGKSSPTIDTTAFVNYTTSNYYWSSTTGASDTNYAWHVFFFDGYTYYNGKSNNNYVRCVRAGQ